MCIMPSAKTPPAPPTPTRAPAAPKPADANVQDARKKEGRRARAAGGQSGTILTSGQGLLAPAATTQTLLGTG